MISHSTRTILIAIIVTLAAISMPFIVYAAYDTSQIIGAAQSAVGNTIASYADNSTRLSDLLNKDGLTAYSDLCIASNVFSLFKGGLKNAASQLVGQLGKQMSDLFSQVKSQLVGCAISGALSKLTGGAAGGISCVRAVASDTSAYLQQKALQDATDDFLGRCIANQGINDVAALVDRMIQEQGPGGAAAWAQNWELSAYIEPDQLARRRFWSLLVNTDICEYMKQDMLDYFDVPQAYHDNPPDISSLDLRVNADAPFTLTGACTLPKDYDANKTVTADEFTKQGGYKIIEILSEPQNNPNGFILLAGAELARQQDAMLESANTQLIAGGGFLSTYGNAGENCIQAPDGNGCISYGTIKQAPGAVRDMRNMSVQAQADFLNDAGEAMEDMATRIQVRLLDLANQPLPIKFELSRKESTSSPTPTPIPSSIPGSGDANDPVCTGGNPQCTCIKNDTSAQALASTAIKNATIQAVQSNPALFVWGTNEITPGTDRQLVLRAICTALSGIACQPHPTQSDQIVIVTEATTLGFSVITPNGFVRTSGAVPVAACELGVQN